MIRIGDHEYKFRGIVDGRACFSRMSKVEGKSWWGPSQENPSFKIYYSYTMGHYITVCRGTAGEKHIKVKELLDQWDLMQEINKYSLEEVK